MTTEATPGALGSNEWLGAVSEARQPWSAIGWGVSAYSRAGMAHLWQQSQRKRSHAHPACGNGAPVDQRDLQPLDQGLRVCERCLKSAAAKADGAPEAPNVRAKRDTTA